MLAHSSTHASPAVKALLAASGLDPGAVKLDVDARDEMLHFALENQHGSREMALAQYFRAGVQAFRVVDRLLESRFGERRREARILDFASGYGRLTRFLLGCHPAENLRVAEIDAGATAFQEETFGVRGLVSARDPGTFVCAERFDLIFVASLFSHLPRETFEAWLSKLAGLLAPGGLLAFTVHDEAVMLSGRALPDDGFYFEAVSESTFLDLADYGSTWVTEAFMAGAFERLGLPGASWRRLPRALWHLQDLYLFCPDGTEIETAGLERGLEGYLDVCTLGDSGSLTVGGWAVDHAGPGERPLVELRIGGTLCGSGKTSVERPDVVRFLGGEAHPRSGWSFDLAPREPPFDSADLVVVTARSGSGEPWVLFAGTLETALLFAALDRDRHELRQLREGLAHTQMALTAERAVSQGLRDRAAELGARIESLGYERHLLELRLAAMESSRFWKLRNRWFRLKKALGLSAE